MSTTKRANVKKRTRPDIMVIIHLPNLKKGGIVRARGDLINNCFQSLICWHMVYKKPQDSNVNHILPNVLAFIRSSQPFEETSKVLNRCYTHSRCERDVVVWEELGVATWRKSYSGFCIFCSKKIWPKVTWLKHVARCLSGINNNSFESYHCLKVLNQGQIRWQCDYWALRLNTLIHSRKFVVNWAVAWIQTTPLRLRWAPPEDLDPFA